MVLNAPRYLSWTGAVGSIAKKSRAGTPTTAIKSSARRGGPVSG